MRIRDEDLRDELEINMTPMIDVVFMLLIFFMVATTFLDPEKEMDVRLPEAESGSESEVDPDKIVINVDESGRIVMGGEELQEADLEARLERAAARNPDIPVEIRGDGQGSYQNVMNVMDVCGIVGLVNLSLGVLDG